MPLSARDLTPKGLIALGRTPSGAKLAKYSAVSVISVIVSQIALLGFGFAFHATVANVLAVAVGTVPSYELNRKWAWGKTGKGHLWREVVPFWALSFIGLLVSTLCVALVVSDVVGHDPVTAKEKLLIQATNLASFGVLWVGKFLIINKLLFHHQHDVAPTEDLANA